MHGYWVRAGVVRLIFLQFSLWGKLHQLNGRAVIEDHGHLDSSARTVRRNQDLLPSQCSRKIIYLESYMRNGLDHLWVRCAWIKSHPLHTIWTGSKTRNVNMQVGYVNLIGARSLSGNSNVVIAPAISADRRGGFVVLPQIFIQTGIPFRTKLLHD